MNISMEAKNKLRSLLKRKGWDLENVRESENEPGYVVLASRGTEKFGDEFVTWISDGNSFYWGHYFTEPAEAGQDFESR